MVSGHAADAARVVALLALIWSHEVLQAFRIRWDIASMLVLLYCLIEIPFRVAFESDVEGGSQLATLPLPALPPHADCMLLVCPVSLCACCHSRFGRRRGQSDSGRVFPLRVRATGWTLHGPYVSARLTSTRVHVMCAQGVFEFQDSRHHRRATSARHQRDSTPLPDGGCRRASASHSPLTCMHQSYCNYARRGGSVWTSLQGTGWALHADLAGMQLTVG